jgi:hypothetical protein
MERLLRKTPENATELEREQLRFLLGKESDISALLVELNPSLAWLPLIAQLNVPNRERQLAIWVQHNLAEQDAVKEVAANIRLFGLEAANIIELGLERSPQLPDLLAKCWRLIIRHMKRPKDRWSIGNWYDIAPRVRRGEHSPDLLEQIAQVLRPTLYVGKRFSIYVDEPAIVPSRPSDLLSIDFKVDDGVTDSEVLGAWPANASPETDSRLLNILTHCLTTAIEEAIDAGVDGYRGFGISDSDVPSVAAHRQNEYHSGFLPIVRVIAELWTRLTEKNTNQALRLVQEWRESQLRLIRRIALFAVTNPKVPAEVAADTLLSLPQDELFLGGSSVEVYRLLRARWADFSNEKQLAIQERAIVGPRPDAFKEGSDKDRAIDHCRFEFLGALKTIGAALVPTAEATFNEIKRGRSAWQMRPEEQWGFHVWSEGVQTASIGDPAALDGIPDDQLISAAQGISEGDIFAERGDALNALAKRDPDRVLRALQAQAKSGIWEAWAWRSFLWSAENLREPVAIKDTAFLLSTYPSDKAAEISFEASWWLNEKAKLIDAPLIWAAWDHLEAVSPRATDMSMSHDSFTDALNSSAGKLAEVLLKKVYSAKVGADRTLPDDIATRLELLLNATGNFGQLARVRLAADLSHLFERAPGWTEPHIVPMFFWSSPEAEMMWDARRYSNYIGSPRLFELTKQPFLDLFGKPNIPEDRLNTFASWLTTIMIANQSQNAGYPISPTEARSALRQAGTRTLQAVGHRLALEMERIKPEEKLVGWRNVVGPVFRSIWPLDIDLQSAESTFKLVQILRASGSAFSEATATIIPFIRPEKPHRSTTVFSISQADEALYSSAPDKMLDLLAAVVGDADPRTIYSIETALSRIAAHAPRLTHTTKFRRLSAASANLE